MTTDTQGQLKSFKMPVQGGMLEALGINLYANLGKCLVEFAANSYDGDANSVNITIPFVEIKTERSRIRQEAKNQENNDIDPYLIFDSTLDEKFQVTIRDDGHGMTPEEVQKKFLPLNRNRRKDSLSNDENLKSASGKRYVMGRKGLGKLAGFGAADKVIIKTKQKDQNYVTEFCLDLEILKSGKSIEEVEIPATYHVDNTDQQFTEITLTRLKFGAVAQREKTIIKEISRNFFGIRPEDFKIKINGEPIKAEKPSYELYHPSNADEEKLFTDEITIPDSNIKLIFQYRVMFRGRGDSLKASARGVRIYCNNRLAAGPTLLNLNTGMHNFYAIDYMEMVVQADDLDRHGIDLINTNRTQLKSNNELIEAFFTRLELHMKLAVKAHSSFRDSQADKQLKENKEAQVFHRIISNLPKKSKRAGMKLLKAIATEYGVESTNFTELAPLVVQSMNASEVLIKLIEAGTKAETISEISGLLLELSEIEQDDALKLFRARKSGIAALARMIVKANDLWGKKQFEAEFHNLLKENSWLIKPDLATHSNSDENLVKVASRIAEHLSVDEFAKITKDDGSTDNARPDLVYILSDTPDPYEIHIVELKSPSLALNIEHLDQLDTYMFKINGFIKQHYGSPIAVKGVLIGTRPKTSTSKLSEQRLLDKIGRNSLGEIEIISLEEMLARTQRAHTQMVEAIESEETEELSETKN